MSELKIILQPEETTAADAVSSMHMFVTALLKNSLPKPKEHPNIPFLYAPAPKA